jgi:hypothetical protein
MKLIRSNKEDKGRYLGGRGVIRRHKKVSRVKE